MKNIFFCFLARIKSETHILIWYISLTFYFGLDWTWLTAIFQKIKYEVWLNKKNFLIVTDTFFADCIFRMVPNFLKILFKKLCGPVRDIGMSFTVGINILNFEKNDENYSKFLKNTFFCFFARNEWETLISIWYISLTFYFD